MLFWQDSSGNMLNPVVGLLEFIAKGPAVAALQGALLPSSKLEAATIENYQVNMALADRTLVANSKGDKVASELIAQGRRPSRSTGLRGRDRELRQILEPGHQIADDPVSDSPAGRGYFSPMKPEASRPSVKQVERINL
jgi:hypothetical protein